MVPPRYVILKVGEQLLWCRENVGSLLPTEVQVITRCIESGFTLLYSDRDFETFVQHLGLRSALLET